VSWRELSNALMELKRPREALVEYKIALTLSPNRLNGLYGAGRATEALGMKKEAGDSYAVMLKNTAEGAHSSRPSLMHAQEFVAGKVVAGN
jgi:hypothetical protein